jgi:hypothetical protein
MTASSKLTEATAKAPSKLERQTYTIKEAAQILGICPALAYRKGVLPTVQIAGRRLVPKQALDRMLSE